MQRTPTSVCFVHVLSMRYCGNIVIAICARTGDKKNIMMGMVMVGDGLDLPWIPMIMASGSVVLCRLQGARLIMHDRWLYARHVLYSRVRAWQSAIVFLSFFFWALGWLVTVTHDQLVRTMPSLSPVSNHRRSFSLSLRHRVRRPARRSPRYCRASFSPFRLVLGLCSPCLPSSPSP